MEMDCIEAVLEDEVEYEIPLCSSVGNRRKNGGLCGEDDAMNELNEMERVDLQALFNRSQEGLAFEASTPIQLECDVAESDIAQCDFVKRNIAECNVVKSNIAECGVGENENLCSSSVGVGKSKTNIEGDETALDRLSLSEDFDGLSLCFSTDGSIWDGYSEAEGCTIPAHVSKRNFDRRQQGLDESCEGKSEERSAESSDCNEGALQTEKHEQAEPQISSKTGERRSTCETSKAADKLQWVLPKKLPTLHRAIWKGKLNKVLKYFSKAGNQRKANKLDRYGRTPLMLAAAFDRSDMVHILLMVGADPCLKDRENQDALCYAPSLSKSADAIMRAIEESSLCGAETAINDDQQGRQGVPEKNEDHEIISKGKRSKEQKQKKVRKNAKNEAMRNDVRTKSADIQKQASTKPSPFMRVWSLFSRRNAMDRSITTEDWADEHKQLVEKYGRRAGKLQALEHQRIAMASLKERIEYSLEELRLNHHEKLSDFKSARLNYYLLCDKFLDAEIQRLLLIQRNLEFGEWCEDLWDLSQRMIEDKNELQAIGERDLRIIAQLKAEKESAARLIPLLKKAAKPSPMAASFV